MKIIHVSGKRKTAIARATLSPEGKGNVRVNGTPIDSIRPELVRDKVQEPLLLAPDVAKTVDINVDVSGGGAVSQADACRLSIARALVLFNKKLEPIFLKYDRNLLVADVRFKETHKPNCHGKARAKRQKSYR
jgi:small subunit ribosomal protein S9